MCVFAMGSGIVIKAIDQRGRTKRRGRFKGGRIDWRYQILAHLRLGIKNLSKRREDNWPGSGRWCEWAGLGLRNEWDFRK